MAGETSLTQISGSIMDMVRETALEALYDRAKLLPAVTNVTKEIPDGADRVSIPIIPALTVRSITTGTGQINSGQGDQYTVTSQEVQVDSWEGVPVEIPFIASVQARFDMLKSFSTGMGRALAQKLNVDICTEHSNITGQTAQGDSGTPTPLDDQIVRGAIGELDDDDVPEDDRHFILHPVAESQLLALTRFSESQNTGFGRGVQVGGNSGKLEGLYGVPVLKTTSVQTSSNAYANLLVHKDCLGVAIQRNFRVYKGQGIANFKLTDILIGAVLYGVDVIRSDHGVVLYSSQSR